MLILIDATITATDISKILDVPIATVKRRFDEFKAKGIITRIGSRKTGMWQINKL